MYHKVFNLSNQRIGTISANYKRFDNLDGNLIHQAKNLDEIKTYLRKKHGVFKIITIHEEEE